MSSMLHPHVRASQAARQRGSEAGREGGPASGAVLCPALSRLQGSQA